MSKVVNPEQWVRNHKKEFVNKLIGPYLDTIDGSPSAIFMAGLPGAGKTEFTKGLIFSLQLKLLRLDMDEIASQIDFYKPQDADKYRKGATILLEHAFSTCIKKRISFVMDGTFGSPKALLNIQRTLKREYFVKVIYIYQDPKVAWDFTRKREEIEHRAIKLGGFIDSYFNVLHNLQTLSNMNLDNLSIDLVIKGTDNKIQERFVNINSTTLDRAIKQDYNKDSLKGYING